MITVRGVNLKTLTAWDQSKHESLGLALHEVDKLRQKRGNWRDDPVVYAVSRRSMEEVSDVEVPADPSAASEG